VIVNDYTVLAGTQGYFHHRKIDRMLEQAKRGYLPVVMYTEGGGGRPGDTDVKIQIAGLDVPTFASWASLSGQVPMIAVNNGYCFAGNAALFGCADIRIATKSSWIGMAGPAMIEGGGLGNFAPTDIGPMDVQSKNGVVDLVADDEAHATALAQQCLSYFQGGSDNWQCADQLELREMMPADRRYVYDVRSVITKLMDSDSFLELSHAYGCAVITGFARIEGRAVGIIANDCRYLGGAVDAEAAEKTARFITLCDSFDIPLVSLCDSPGFMVGPASEEQAAVRRMAQLFIAGAKLSTPLVTIFLRKGYGLGAMAMAGGSFHKPIYSASWPTGEFGGMGLEGAVRLGFKKELEAIAEGAEREALFTQLVDEMYERGKATEAAAHLEIDAVIDPADTRGVIVRAFDSRVN
jgi:acetyl-CoA carboxylase carboxyltransferase component